jgi:hypothetical protein
MHPQYNDNMIIKENEGQIKQVLSGGWNQWNAGGHKGRMKEKTNIVEILCTHA